MTMTKYLFNSSILPASFLYAPVDCTPMKMVNFMKEMKFRCADNKNISLTLFNKSLATFNVFYSISPMRNGQ